MKHWRRTPPIPVVVIPEPRTDVPMQGPTEGELARERAVQALGQEMQKTAAIRAETPAYERLGARLGALRERNHIREDIYRSIVGSA